MLPFLSKFLHSCRFIAKWCNCDNNWECLQCFILFTAWLGWTQTFLQVFGYLWWASVARENYSSNLNSNQITNQIQINIGPVLKILMAHYSLNRALVIAFAHKKLETSPVFAFLGKGNLLGWKRFTSFLYPRNCWKGWGFRQHR